MTLRVLDLFCGAGGFSLGFHQAEFEIVSGLDFDSDAIDTFNRHFRAPGYPLDLGENEPDEILDALPFGASDVDIIIGGPPCQGFSSAGYRDPEDPRNTLLLRFLDYVEELSPDAFVIENVSQLTSDRYADRFEALISRAETLGYGTDHRLLTASDYGIPQKRKRVFIMGIRDGTPEWPEPTTPDTGPTVREYLTDLLTMRVPDDVKSDHGDDVVRKWYQTDYNHDPNGSNHQIRLDPDKPARTITSSNSHWHFGKARTLTVREEATLQSFPLGYDFYGTKTSKSQQVGNAVPPALAKHIALAVRKSLGEHQKEVPTDSVGMSMREIASIGGRLTEREVEALLLRNHGWQWSDIADEMDVAISTAHEYYSRAEKKYQESVNTVKTFERLTRQE